MRPHLFYFNNVHETIEELLINGFVNLSAAILEVRQ